MTLVADNSLIFLFSKVKSLYSMLYLLQNLNFQKNQKVFLILLCLIGTGCQKPIALNEYTFRGSSMGTTFLVKIAAEKMSEQQQKKIYQTIRTKLSDINNKMSTYLDSSEISHLNRFKKTIPLRLSAETLTVMAEAQLISRLTQGALDITINPLVNAWGFGPEPHPSKIPTAQEISQLKSKIGWEKLELDFSTSTIRKLDPEISCDLSAIAKGYAVDQLSDTLLRLNFLQHMVELGGEVKASGHNASSQTWKIAIEKPSALGEGIQRILPLSSLAIATSGDYRNFYDVKGVRFSHTIDPRNGRPVDHSVVSVSVVDPSCMRADGYATALLVLGETKGYQLATEQDLAVLFLIRTAQGSFREIETPAFQRIYSTGQSL